MKATLVLEDGTYYQGIAFGKPGTTHGEVVFNTCMTGYQEVLTDPSYRGQMVVMTYPLIGNYGFNQEDSESGAPHVRAFIVRELCDYPSNWRSNVPSGAFFQDIMGISDIDTRHLTQHIRERGSMYAVLTTESADIEALAAQAKELAVEPKQLVEEVTCKEPRVIEGKGPHVAVLDFGIKENILRSLHGLGAQITVLPAATTADAVKALSPDAILLSNGPGDPRDIPYVIDTIKELLGYKPTLGICLGHQLLGMALGGAIYKLKFGHHGGNHPVKDLVTGRVYITSQNHNYALTEDFSPDIEITHMNLNDNTVEGFVHKHLPILSVQYHPEAAPGPLDSGYIFHQFFELLKAS
jgi:carbamoyl-phosphate synthase small subunit